MEDLELEMLLGKSKEKNSDTNGKSMMDLFIEDLIGNDMPYITEITEKEYRDLYFQKNYTKKAITIDILQDLRHPPFPLFKFHIVVDRECSYESGSKDWEFEFIFKHKGKHYLFIEHGGN